MLPAALARICLFALATLSLLGAAESPEQLIQRAHKAPPAQAMDDVRKALQIWEQSGSTETGRYANALVVLGLLIYTHDKADPAQVAANIGPLAEHAVNICGTVACLDDTLPLALDLQAEVLSANSDQVGAHAAQIRAAQLRNFTFSTPGDFYRVGPGGVTAPTIVSKKDPEYSEAARLARREGNVLLQIVVNADGTPQVTRVVRALGFGLDEKAIEAVSQWKFSPGMKGGTPVSTAANVEVIFHLL